MIALPAVPTVLSAHERSAFTAALTATDCLGCVGERPHLQCAACGQAAAIALGDQLHQMSLCRRCEGIVLAIRADAARNPHRGRQEPLIYTWGTPAPPRVEQAPLAPHAPRPRKRPPRHRTVHRTAA